MQKDFPGAQYRCNDLTNLEECLLRKHKIYVMTNREEMDTLTTVLEHLKQKHQYNEFTMGEHGLVSLSGKSYKEDEVRMIRTYRFEGDSDPSEEAIVYIIEAKDGSIGYSIDNYGVYANHTDDEYGWFIKRLTSVHSKIK